MTFFLGLDFGTSGARAIAIDAEGNLQARASLPYETTQAPATVWKNILFSLFEGLPLAIRKETGAIAINGTSATVLLCDRNGSPLDTLLYNDARAAAEVARIPEIVPSNAVVLSASSSLAKLLWWTHQPFYTEAAYFLHQADWLAFLLHAKLGISDYHNALKLGYDVENLCYPAGLQQHPARALLPKILPPGTPVGEVTAAIAQRFGFPKTCQVCTGTTDSIAAFIASGATYPGQAVTSLGSTLVLKLLSRTKVDAAEYGIYSHRLGNLWLTGGASNTGGAVLRHYFSDSELADISQHIDPQQASPLDYYPLLGRGDRFPINDPNLLPRLEPRPDNEIEFLHGLLESLARIEAKGYALLQQFGATPLTRIHTAGGGAQNPTWTAIRQRHLCVPVAPSLETEAAYGTALLAKQSFSGPF